MQHCALQHSAWHGICMGRMRLSGMNLAGVGGDGGASDVNSEIPIESQPIIEKYNKPYTCVGH